MTLLARVVKRKNNKLISSQKGFKFITVSVNLEEKGLYSKSKSKSKTKSIRYRCQHKCNNHGSISRTGNMDFY